MQYVYCLDNPTTRIDPLGMVSNVMRPVHDGGGTPKGNPLNFIDPIGKEAMDAYADAFGDKSIVYEALRILNANYIAFSKKENAPRHLPRINLLINEMRKIGLKIKVKADDFFARFGGCLSNAMDFFTSKEQGVGSFKLNPVERVLYTEYPDEGAKYLLAGGTAIAETLLIYSDPVDGANSNAFQHSYWSGLLTMWIGAKAAQKWTDAHEYGAEGNEELGSEMDFLNNEFGMKAAQAIGNGFGAEATLSIFLQIAVSEGELVRINPMTGKIVNGQIEKEKLVPTNGDGRWLSLPKMSIKRDGIV